MPDAATAPQLTDEEYETILLDDELYFESCLMIRTKDAGLQPLKLNSSQRFVHDRIEEQLARTGRVRVLIPKGRQQGVSTYIGARFYKKVSTSTGVLAFIVTHEDAATQNLFGMTKRYHDNNLPDFKPETGVANANELRFSRLDSGYKIATAGARTAGRSNTIQYLHASEFDFWPEASADEVWRGLYQAVPKADETEVALESTCDKPGGRFHNMILAALAGESEFEVLFVPWFIHDEYRTAPPHNWAMPEAFEEYQSLHGLDRDQVYWAWLENRDMAVTFGLGSDEICIAFKREYPGSIEEAFEISGDELRRAIPLSWLRAAQRRYRENRSRSAGPMQGLGVDVAQGGNDKTVAAPVHGKRVEKLTVLKGHDTKDGPAVAGAVVSVLRDDAVTAVDMGGGWGGDAYTHLKKHLKLPAVGVDPSERATRKSRDGKYEFVNMRAQLYWMLREALNPITGDEVELPDDDEELIQDLAAAEFDITPRGIQIESKDNIKKRLKRSPDRGDAVLLGWHASDKAVRTAIKAETIRDRQRSATRGGERPAAASRTHARAVGRR